LARCSIGSRAGMLASSRASKSVGTGAGGKRRSRASKESGFSILSSGMIGYLFIQQNPQPVERLRGPPFDRAARFIQHGGHLAITQPLQVMQHQHRALRNIEAIEELI